MRMNSSSHIGAGVVRSVVVVCVRRKPNSYVDVQTLEEGSLGREGQVLEADSVADPFCSLVIRVSRKVDPLRRADQCIMPKAGPLTISA